MSNYRDQVLKYIEEHPDFIQPVARRNENDQFHQGRPGRSLHFPNLLDWGIPVPINDKHIIYVWFDALTNYISALGYGSEDTALYDKVLARGRHLMAGGHYPLPYGDLAGHAVGR